MRKMGEKKKEKKNPKVMKNLDGCRKEAKRKRKVEWRKNLKGYEGTGRRRMKERRRKKEEKELPQSWWRNLADHQKKERTYKRKK